MGNIIAETEKRRHLYQYRRFLLTTEYECAIISLIVLQESQTQNCILGDNMFITNVDEKELPNILIGQITEKVEPFVLEDTKLKETDIEKIPKESELHKQLVKLVQLRSALAILPFVIMSRRQYIVRVRDISKEYEKIASKINPDYKPPLIQEEELALNLFVSFVLESTQNIESEKLDSWLNELLSVSEVLILINKTNRLTMIKNKGILGKEDIQKQVCFHIYCHSCDLFTDINTLLKNRISDNAILGSSPSFSFALRELVDNHINFSYLLKNPEDCQQMFDYLRYYESYIRTQNSRATLTLKRDFLLKYNLSEKTKEQIQKGEKSMYSVINNTPLHRWTEKSQEELLSKGAYNDQDKAGIISVLKILKEIHSIIGHGDLLQGNNLGDLEEEKTEAFVHLTLSTQVHLDVTYGFLSLIGVLDYNDDLINIQATLNKYKEVFTKSA